MFCISYMFPSGLEVYMPRRFKSRQEAEKEASHLQEVACFCGKRISYAVYAI